MQPATHSKTQMQVLLVEDDDGDARQVERSLESAGGRERWQVARVGSLEEASVWLSTTTPDVVLLDLSVRGMSGLEALDELRRFTSSPIVVMTDTSDEEEGARAMRRGAQDYLIKGLFGSEVLRRVLHYAVERNLNDIRMRQMFRLEAVGQLAGGIAHDFNNLLLVIMGSSEMLAVEGPLEPRQRERLGEIVAAARRAEDVTRKLLAFSRQQVMSSRPLSLNAVLRDLEKLLGRVLGEHLRVVLELEEGLPNILGDPGQIEQVVFNLGVNARDAMPDGGVLRLTTRRVVFEPGDGWLDAHPPQAPGAYVRLSVADTGSGMTPEVRARAFEPFFTTKTGGTGLGLATVYGIVKQSGGYVWVESEPGRGTRFDIFFPCQDEAPASRAAKAVREEEAGSVRRILLVEDDDSVRRLTEDFLSRQGHEVRSAGDGIEALKLLKQSPVDLLVTDVIMPRMSGPALADRVRREWPEIRILYVSGYTTQEVLRQGLLDPGQNFLRKPFSRRELLDKIAELDAD
ncbi:MAG TPA: response regulator [Thermoanaerobaculia bacterium]|nr:response regulator [Thermoanaerobaculia bacterium]